MDLGGRPDQCIRQPDLVFAAKTDRLSRNRDVNIQNGKPPHPRFQDSLFLWSAGADQHLHPGDQADGFSLLILDQRPGGFETVQIVDQNVGVQEELH